jgi:hypothetical protein
MCRRSYRTQTQWSRRPIDLTQIVSIIGLICPTRSKTYRKAKFNPLPVLSHEFYSTEANLHTRTSIKDKTTCAIQPSQSRRSSSICTYAQKRVYGKKSWWCRGSFLPSVGNGLATAKETGRQIMQKQRCQTPDQKKNHRKMRDGPESNCP